MAGPAIAAPRQWGARRAAWRGVFPGGVLALILVIGTGGLAGVATAVPALVIPPMRSPEQRVCFAPPERHRTIGTHFSPTTTPIGTSARSSRRRPSIAARLLPTRPEESGRRLCGLLPTSV